ncbi:hypothetical protein [Histidinibacterium lentulum]|uniref:Class I SAM-dependent methyltransferase n=1 Tax=Histidinibacterium lentulum TaxID=2480588 RepID=A0A3N2R7J2_9RHOB|nr:hypothetical protein [Histidinibacterium lentulum]ROU03368.1 hypothetical protein EAT49_03405 [Histidinibacterium lentulum]
MAAGVGHVLARSHCGACLSYHAVWPYLRLLDPPRGVDADRPVLEAVLDPLLFDGARVLLAGSADAGLADCVLEIAGERAIALTVMDLCATPLLQCETLLHGRARGGLTTRRGSICVAPEAPDADLIVAHSVLSFLPASDLAAAGAALGESLLPGGRLVLTTGLGRAAPSFDADTFGRHSLSRFAAASIALPESEAAFGVLLDDYARQRSRRASPFPDREGLCRWLAEAGLELETMRDLRRGSGFGRDGAPVSRDGSGALVVARKGRTG